MPSGSNVQEPLSGGSEDWPSSVEERIAKGPSRRARMPESRGHDDYASFFVPAELADRAKERNSVATEAAQMGETATRTSGKKDAFDPFAYTPFGLGLEEQSRNHPWPVPLLEIIEPSPPRSVSGDITPPGSKSSGSPRPREQKQKRPARVTWGSQASFVDEVEPAPEGKEEPLVTENSSKSRPGLGSAFPIEERLATSKPLSKSYGTKSRRHIESDYHEQARRSLPRQCLDITQSKWVQDPNDPSEEIVSLTSFQTSTEATSAKTSFRWIHVQRDKSPISFEDFEDVLYKTPGLWDYEVAVASKCIQEVKLKRKGFARGKYYGPTVHQAHSVLSASAVEKVPVHATFLSMPIFAVLPSYQSGLQNESQPTFLRQFMQSLWRYISMPLSDADAELPYWNNRDWRSSREHPIRSLLQYYNIVTIDDERDRRQVITKFARDVSDEDGYIHVPEIWALTVNMYTVITCAPFSARDLCGENIKIKPEAPKQKDQRIFVKYTNLQGRLHDFRCRTWFGLLHIVAGLEQIDDMEILLDDVASDYKLIDLKFRPLDKARFQEIILAESGNTKVINVRLIRVIDDNPLTLAFAEKKLSDCVRDTIILVGLTGVLAELKVQEVRLRKENADPATMDQHKVRIKRSTEMVRKHRRSRMLNRLLLYAARCQILDPLPRRRERSRDRGEIRRLASHAREIENHAEQLHERDRKQPGKLTSSMGSEMETDGPPIPTIVIDGETSSGTKTRMLRQTVLDFYSLERSHTAIPVTSPTPDCAQKELAMQPPPSAELRDHPTLPSHNDRWKTRRASTTSLNYAKPSGRAEKSAGGPVPSIVAAKLPISSLPDIEPDGQERRSPLILRRANSTANHRRAAPSTVLPASPQRLPLRSEGDSAILIPSRSTEKADTTGTGMNDQWLFKSSLDVLGTLTPSLDNNDQAILQTLHSQARRKSRERFSGPTPFFEVQTSARPPENMDVKDTDTSTAGPKIRSKDDLITDGQPRSTGNEGSTWDRVNDILSSIDDLICDGDFGKHSHSLASAIKPNQYNEIELKSESDVISMLEKSDRDAKQSIVGPPCHGYDHAPSEFLKAKMELFLGVHGLVGCFIHHEVRSEAKIVGKIWGIVYRICELNPHSMPASRQTSAALTLSPPKHDIQYIDIARREVRRLEQKWTSLLIQIRHDANGEGTTLNYQVLQSLRPAFRNVVLFLLCALLAVNENSIDLDIFNIARDKLNDGIRECEAAFLRITELAEMASDQIGDESIRTADTLLGLLLENAFSFSSRKHVDETGACGKMSLDIEHIYSTYTSQCIIRAKREASARLYEDVLLLKEEIEAIKLVLRHQGGLFQEVLDKRESPPQNLDLRLNDRVIAMLEERAAHFKTLSEYAEQAEIWTRNSIEVRGENNSKAIFIFTTVTIIFLPLSFISSVMSMNTIDVRQMKQGQWLFWAVALPFTVFVLVVCLCIVQYKFKLRRRFRTIVYWPLAYFQRPRDSMSQATLTYSNT